MLNRKKLNYGFTLFEFLVALLVLFFIISGLAVGMRDFLKRQKSLELHNLARQILEIEKGRLLNLPINSISSLERTYTNGVCDLNGTCSFDPDCFNNPMRYNATNCQAPLRCVACLKGKQIIYDDCVNSTYTFNLSYTLANVYTPDPENSTQILSPTPMGAGICMKVEFIDPSTKRTQTYQALVLKLEQ